MLSILFVASINIEFYVRSYLFFVVDINSHMQPTKLASSACEDRSVQTCIVDGKPMHHIKAHTLVRSQ